MTMPNERTRAVMKARDFLLDLCQPKLTPRVPKKVRDEELEALLEKLR